MNSEAKVLVPGIPGHHALIKTPLSQPKEGENKRKLGRNEVITAYLGLKCEELIVGSTLGRAGAVFQNPAAVIAAFQSLTEEIFVISQLEREKLSRLCQELL